jgi:glycosyltransferase 2 family protein
VEGAVTAAHIREVATPRSWHWLGTAGGVAFLVLLGWLIADHVKHIDWPGVRRALAAYPPLTLAGAALLVAASHFTYACYDLLGKRYAHHRLPVRRVLGVAFVSYAFNLNLGTLVGGVGFRLRLYHRVGLGAAQIARVIALSIVTNWSGWFLLTGAVFAARQVPLPESFTFGAGALQVLGVAMLALPLAYVTLCFRSRRRKLHWRSHAFTLPSGRMALAQIGLSTLNWLLIGTIVWLLMPPGLGYGTVVATQLSAAMLAVPTHIPGGLGVLEGIFVAALGHTVETSGLIAALIAYRALYYLIPLAIASVLYFFLEATARRTREKHRSLV